MKISKSELILNADGSIYHLALRPEQVAPLIITVGDQDRVSKVSRYFDRIECRVRKREFVTHTGYIGSTRLSVVSTGIGPDNIDIVLNELDALFNIDFERRTPKPALMALTIIRLGTSGGLQKEIPLDAIVASAGAFGMDGLLQFYDAVSLHDNQTLHALRGHCAEKWSFPLSPYYVEADQHLLRAFGKGLSQGFTATNPGFYGPQGRLLRAPVRMPGYLDMLQQFSFQGQRIVNLEMETAAIYGLAQLLGHRAISLSAILANRPNGTFSQNPGSAVKNLIEFALEKISSGF